MLTTYEALLCDGRLEWTHDVPRNLPLNRAVQVHVTILQGDATENGHEAKGESMAAALAQLAAIQSGASISNPDAWERDQREDRDLPGRI